MKRLFACFSAILLFFACSKEPETPAPQPKPKFTITIEAGEGGSVSSTGGSYEQGSTFSVTATASSGYRFTGWSNGESSATLNITVTGNLSVTALFEKITYSVDISGAVSKGAFLTGSTLTFYELNSTLSQTGKSYNTDITDNFGTYALNVEELTEDYARVVGEGFYWNEVNNTNTEEKLSLNAIAEVKEGININVLTHLEYQRVIELVKNQGKSFVDAKKQALTETLSSLGIEMTSDYGTSEQFNFKEGDEKSKILVVASAIIQGERTPAEVTELITTIANDLKDNGNIDNTVTKSNIAVGIESLDLNVVASNIYDRYKEDYPELTQDSFTSNYLDLAKTEYQEFLPDEDNDGVWDGLDTCPDTPEGEEADENGCGKTQKQYQLTTTVEGEGSISEEIIEQTTASYDYGTTVRLIANPSIGWEFKEWTGGITSTENPIDITVVEEVSVTAVFVRKKFTVTTNTEGEGTVSIAPAEESYEYESTVELTATPSEGWVFSEWKGVANSSENPLSLVIEENKEITAVFKRKQYDLSINIEGEGTVAEEIVAQPSQYEYETQVKLTANSIEGWEFAGWSGDIEGTENPITITIDKAKVVTATFQRKQFTITTETSGSGIITLTPLSEFYEFESSIQLSAEPSEGWAFGSWSGDIESEENPLEFRITKDLNIKANFEQISPTIGSSDPTDDEEMVISLFSDIYNDVQVDTWRAEWSNSGQGVNVVYEEIEVEGNKIKHYSNLGFVGIELTSNPVDARSMTHLNFHYWTPNGEELGINLVDFGYDQQYDGGDDSNHDYVLSDVTRGEWVQVRLDLSEFTNLTRRGSIAQIILVGRTPYLETELFIDNLYFSNDGTGIADYDEDGVIDSEDNCPETPLNTVVDSNGCALDKIYLDDNGVTIRASQNGLVGDVVDLDGISYTIVDDASIREMVNRGDDMSKVVTTYVTNMEGLFLEMESFNDDISSWDVSNVTTMRRMFESANTFNQDLNYWDVSLVESISYMFYGAEKFNKPLNLWRTTSLKFAYATFASAQNFNQDISSWDVSNVADMSYMFSNAESFNQPLESWDMSSVESTSYMFYNTVFDQPLNQWNVSKLVNASYMFRNSAFNQDISDWQTLSLTDMTNMFAFTPFNQDISGWDVSSVTSMNRLFTASKFNQDISGWDVSNVTDMTYMFGITDFDKTINDWDISSLQNASHMFTNSKFNKPLNNWDTSNVTDMSNMFSGAEFNQDIGEWDTSSVINMMGMFSNNSSFNQDISNWDVGLVEDMSYMFSTSVFNGEISSWNVSSVTNMRGMFITNQVFNQSLKNWDVSNVQDMVQMFYGANSFNQDLTRWCVQNITDYSGFAEGATAFESTNLPKWGYCPLPEEIDGDNDGVEDALDQCPNSLRGVTVDETGCRVAPIYIDDNGVTIKAKSFAQPGETWSLNGKTYTVVDDAMLREMVQEGEDMSLVVTTLVTNMGGLFRNKTYFNDDISSWDTSNVLDLSWMFDSARYFNQDIGKWNTSKCTKFYAMFMWAEAFNQDINDWDVSKGQDFWRTFYGAISFNKPLNRWDTSSMTSLYATFAGATSFNQDLSSWNTSNVTNMLETFSNARNFNGDLSTWDTSKVTTMQYMFQGAIKFNQNLNDWNVSNVTNMENMFSGAAEFNTPLNDWDVSNVQLMTSMFANTVFNQPLDSWNTAKVTSMGYMFGNSKMNQDLSSWNVGRVVFCSGFSSNNDSWSLPKPNFTNCSPEDEGA